MQPKNSIQVRRPSPRVSPYWKFSSIMTSAPEPETVDGRRREHPLGILAGYRSSVHNGDTINGLKTVACGEPLAHKVARSAMYSGAPVLPPDGPLRLVDHKGFGDLIGVDTSHDGLWFPMRSTKSSLEILFRFWIRLRERWSVCRFHRRRAVPRAFPRRPFNRKWSGSMRYWGVRCIDNKARR